jgi:phage antirepressor YoqD-like protein
MIQFEIENGHHETFYDVSDVAKALNLKHEGKTLGRNKFMELLRYNGYIMSDSNQPKQIAISLGLMRYHMVNRRYKKYGMPLFSEKGLNYLSRKIETGDIQIGFQKKIKRHYTVKLEDIV